MAKKGKFASKGAWALVSGGKMTPAKAPPKQEKPSKAEKPPKVADPPKKEKPPKMADPPKQEKSSKAAPKQNIPKKTPPPAPEAPPVTPLRKAWEVIKTIFTYLIMALAVAMMIFTAVSVTSFDRNDRDLFGYKAFIVRSDSMSATDFSAGDLVIIQEVDPGLLQSGDIIAFTSEDPNSLGETFTHKIRTVETDEYGQRSFITYGTTTNVDDLYPVAEAKVLGRYRFAVPKMGTFFAFMKTTPGYICCIFVPFLLLLLFNGGSLIRGFRQMYQEKEEQTQAEHQAKMDELSAQQALIQQQQQQMAAMLQEMRQLQSELREKQPQ